MALSFTDRIKQFLKSEHSNDENFIVEAFAKQEHENDLRKIALENWEMQEKPELNLQHVLNKIHFQINTQSVNRPLTKVINYFYKIAAILIIPLLIGMGILWFNAQSASDTYAEITSLKGSRAQFVLPDGTQGYLNSGSTLKYAVNFIGNRNVELDGEAYFKVVKDSKNPFTVKTAFADVRVLGTCFDVCAYASDLHFTTTLEEGAVEIFNKKSKGTMLLKPGQHNTIDTNTGKMQKWEVNTTLYTSWKDNLLRFDNAQFSEVVKKMERWYGVKIKVEKSILENERYTMTIMTESLREMLELLSFTAPFEYEIKDDKVFITEH